MNQQPGNRVRHDAVGDVEENVTHYPAHNEADMLQAFATAAGRSLGVCCYDSIFHF